MSGEMAAGWVVWGAGAYLALGVVFALLFLLRGVERLDPAVRGSSVGFRLVVLPGVVTLWPLLLWRWARGRRGVPVEANAHRRAAGSGAGERV